jgi:hypothetical protein
MGFGLEYLILGELTAAEPDLEWCGRFVPTDRTAPAAGVYTDAGFTRADGTQELWSLAPGDARPERTAWLD